MKMIIVLSALVAVALAAPAPQQQDKDAVILKSDNDISPDGSYQYSWETSNGQSASEQGQLINPGTENEAIAVRGQFSFLGADGVTYTVTYIADENGFQPQGAHLPQAP